MFGSRKIFKFINKPDEIVSQSRPQIRFTLNSFIHSGLQGGSSRGRVFIQPCARSHGQGKVLLLKSIWRECLGPEHGTHKHQLILVKIKELGKQSFYRGKAVRNKNRLESRSNIFMVFVFIFNVKERSYYIIPAFRFIPGITLQSADARAFFNGFFPEDLGISPAEVIFRVKYGKIGEAQIKDRSVNHNPDLIFRAGEKSPSPASLVIN